MYYYDIYDLSIITPEIFLFCSLLLLLICGSLNFRNNKSLENVYLTSKILITLLVGTIVLLLNNLENRVKGFIFYDLFAIENFSTLAKIFVLLLTISTMCSAKLYAKQNNLKEYEYVIVLGLISGGLLIILSAHDFMALYLAIELVSFGLYMLAVIKKKSIYGAEAGMKYFIIGAFAGGIYAYGASLVYIQTGTTNFYSLQYYLYQQKLLWHTNTLNFLNHNYDLLLFGLSLMLVLLVFKIAAAPFHVWSPDVYEGVPLIVTTYYAVVVKFTFLILLIKVLYFVLFDFLYVIKSALILMTVLSLLIGSIGACTQDRIKRLFTYSSISHIGYILLGALTGSELGLSAALLYIFIYTLSNIVLFNFLLSTDHYEYNNDTPTRVATISNLIGVGKANPFVSTLFAFNLLSFAGIPPFAGFFAKILIFTAALQDETLFPLLLVAIISSLISCFYYLKIIKALFFVATTALTSLISLDRTKEITIFWSVLFLVCFAFTVDNTLAILERIWLGYFDLFKK